MTTIEHSDYGRENNPYLLQDSGEKESEEENYDTDVTADARKLIKTITV